MLSVLELKVPPPLVALAVGVGMWFAAPIGPSLALPFALRVALLVAIALGGGAIALAGDIEFRRAKTTINPLKPQNAKALVTSGVYRYTRNPMYLALVLLTLGIAFCAGSLPMFEMSTPTSPWRMTVSGRGFTAKRNGFT